MSDIGKRTISMEEAAMVVNETLRGWRMAIGDDEIATWPEAPEAQKEIHRASIHWYFASPAATPRAFHDMWTAWMFHNGWSYGETRDVEAKRHPLVRPWDELSELQQIKTRLCVAIMATIAPFINRGGEDGGCEHGPGGSGSRLDGTAGCAGQQFNGAHIAMMAVYQHL
jgi:hypothetical protein